MKNLFKKRTAVLSALVLTAAFAFEGQSVFAQVKIGDNPQTINAGSALEIESTSKGLQLPRVNLFLTEVWGLDGTPTRGMQVYNMNGDIFGTPTHPIINQGSGVYYWDGNGWVGTKAFQADAAGDFDWLKTSDNTNPSEPSDISTSIFHGGAGNQEVNVHTVSTAALNTAKVSVETGHGTSIGVKASFFADNATSGSQAAGLEATSVHPIVFRTRPDLNTPPSERFHIAPGGNIGTGGTFDPSYPLQVAGSIAALNANVKNLSTRGVEINANGILKIFNSSLTPSLRFIKELETGLDFGPRIEFLNSPGNNGILNFMFRKPGNANSILDVLSLHENGFISVGSTDLPDYMLDVKGDINAAGEVRNSGIALSSDVRLKTDITEVTNGLELISKLRPVSYRKKESIASNDYKRSEIGFIAQEGSKNTATADT